VTKTGIPCLLPKCKSFRSRWQVRPPWAGCRIITAGTPPSCCVHPSSLIEEVSDPEVSERPAREALGCARNVGDLGWHQVAQWGRSADPPRIMVDTQGLFRYPLLQPISATDLSGELMITGPRDLHARCVRFDSLPRPSHRDADDRAPGAVVGSNECTLVGHSQALRGSELADGARRRSGSRT
jgi:hypothetical protein